MVNNLKVTVVLPAYNASQTLEQTYKEIPLDIVDNVILVDDCSRDNTIEVAQKLGIQYVIRHDKNKGYGGNQKTCYNKALEIGSDIIVMLHPDYQYTPLLLHSMIYLIANGVYEVVFASRILGKGGCFCFAHFRKRSIERRYASVQIHRQPYSDFHRKSAYEQQVGRVSHRLPCLFGQGFTQRQLQ